MDGDGYGSRAVVTAASIKEIEIFSVGVISLPQNQATMENR